MPELTCQKTWSLNECHKLAKCLAKWHVLFLYANFSQLIPLKLSSSVPSHMFSRFHPFSCIIPQSHQPLTPFSLLFSHFSHFFSPSFNFLFLFFFTSKIPPQHTSKLEQFVTVDPPLHQLTLSRSYSTPWREKTHTHTHTVSTGRQQGWGCLSNKADCTCLESKERSC